MIARILLPLHPAIAFGRVVSQAVWLAERFGAHLLLLRVGVAAWDVDDGLGQNQIVTRLTVAGEPVHQIAAAVQTHGIDLIMMATHEKWRAGDGAEGESDFSSFSRHSVVARVIEAAHCPVWVDTGQSMAEAAVREMVERGEFIGGK